MTRLQAYFKDFSALRKREKTAILIVLFLAFIGGAMLSSTIRTDDMDEFGTVIDTEQSDTTEGNTSAQEETPFSAVMTPIEPSPALRLSVDTATVRPMQTFSILVQVHPDTAVPDSVDTVLRFHPGRVKPVTIEEGGIYQMYTKKEIGSNTISISATNPDVRAATGSIVLATVVMQALDRPDTVFIAPDPEKTAVVVDGKNILTASQYYDIAVRIQ